MLLKTDENEDAAVVADDDDMCLSSFQMRNLVHYVKNFVVGGVLNFVGMMEW